MAGRRALPAGGRAAPAGEPRRSADVRASHSRGAVDHRAAPDRRGGGQGQLGAHRGEPRPSGHHRVGCSLRAATRPGRPHSGRARDPHRAAVGSDRRRAAAGPRLRAGPGVGGHVPPSPQRLGAGAGVRSAAHRAAALVARRSGLGAASPCRQEREPVARELGGRRPRCKRRCARQLRAPSGGAVANPALGGEGGRGHADGEQLPRRGRRDDRHNAPGRRAVPAPLLVALDPDRAPLCRRHPAHCPRRQLGGLRRRRRGRRAGERWADLEGRRQRAGWAGRCARAARLGSRA